MSGWSCRSGLGPGPSAGTGLTRSKALPANRARPKKKTPRPDRTDIAHGCRSPARGCTRTAAITGAFVAAHDAVAWLVAQGKLARSPIRDFVAAVSVGIVDGTPLLDLEYVEDAACDTDMNVVMTASGGFVELQGTAEGATFSRAEMDALLALAGKGIGELVAAQRRALAAPLPVAA